MRAIDFLNKLKEKGKSKRKYLPKENYLWYHVKEVIKDPKAEIFLRPYKLEETAISYYAKRTKKGILIPITEEEYYQIWEKRDKEKKIHGKVTTPAPTVRFVLMVILPAMFKENHVEQDTLLIHECSKTEFERIFSLNDEAMKGNFKDYFEEIEKTPEEMGVVMRRYFKDGVKNDNMSKVPYYDYLIKITSKGIKPVTYEIDYEKFEPVEFDLERWYKPITDETNVDTNPVIEIEEVH